MKLLIEDYRVIFISGTQQEEMKSHPHLFTHILMIGLTKALLTLFTKSIIC